MAIALAMVVFLFGRKSSPIVTVLVMIQVLTKPTPMSWWWIILAVIVDIFITNDND